MSQPDLWPPCCTNITASLDVRQPSMLGPLRLLEHLCAQYEATRAQVAAALAASQALVELVVAGLRSGIEDVSEALLR